MKLKAQIEIVQSQSLAEKASLLKKRMKNFHKDEASLLEAQTEEKVF